MSVNIAEEAKNGSMNGCSLINYVKKQYFYNNNDSA
jgi:hypothetical protein